MASIFYTEIFQSIAPSSPDTWEEQDISAHLPTGDDLTVEIVIANSNSAIGSYSVGVRSFDSSLDRRFNLVPALANGGYNCATMHVQVSGGKIELYAPTGVEFFLVGCWVGTKYIETFDFFSPTTLNAWTNKDLSSVGVPSGAIVELMSAQTWGGVFIGNRSVGSTDNRYIKLDIGSDANLRYTTWTSFLQTSGANATIQYYMQDYTLNHRFYNIGYWETPPGDYTDVFQEDEANPTTNNTWEEVDVTGVPSGSVCSFAIRNSDSASRVLGIRESGSSLDRKIYVRFSNLFNTYHIPLCMHVNTQSPVETFSEAATGVTDDFTLLGYWDNLTSLSEITSGQTDLFVRGKMVLSSSGDLFIQGQDIVTSSGDLFIGGKDVLSSSGDLFIAGNETIDSSGDLFITGIDTSSSSGDLFIDGHKSISTSGDLYIAGIGVFSASGDLFIPGRDSATSSGDLYITSHAIVESSVDLFIKSCVQISGTTSPTLFVEGHTVIDASVDLFSLGIAEFSSSGDLYIHGLSLESGSITMYMTVDGHAHAVSSLSKGNLFINGHLNNTTSSDLYIAGLITKSKSIYLFIDGIHHMTYSGSRNLFVNGYEPKPTLACPILDPTASIQITDKLIGVFQDNIDALINQLGKNVYLEFDPIRDPCPNCTYDTVRKRSTGIYIPGGPRPFARGRRCPYCKGKGFIETSVNKCIKCLIQWNPSDAKNFGISISQKSGIVKFKTFLTEADDLIRARTVIANHDIAGQMKLRVKLIQGPIPVGLREDRYCISFWELING